jgi:hypothetical protein
MEQAIGEMLRRRQSIFFGSIFEQEASLRRPVFQENIGYKEKLS